jgi:hypothetical protein
MRIVAADVEEFIEHLQGVKPEQVFNRMVCYGKVRKEISDLKKQIIVQVGCVVQVDAESEYLLVAGEDCGCDYLDQGGESKGSFQAEKLRSRLSQYCNESGLTIKPGIPTE